VSLWVPPLGEMARARRPARVAITVSISRAGAERILRAAMLDELTRRTCRMSGGGDRGDGHAPADDGDGEADDAWGGVLRRVEVIDHRADEPRGCQRSVTTADPAVPAVCPGRSANRHGLIEPHFMAASRADARVSGAADLATVQRFHGYETLAEAGTQTGVLNGNRCHEIALAVARAAEVDLLFNVGLTPYRCGRRRLIRAYSAARLSGAPAGCKRVRSGPRRRSERTRMR